MIMKELKEYKGSLSDYFDKSGVFTEQFKRVFQKHEFNIITHTEHMCHVQFEMPKTEQFRYHWCDVVFFTGTHGERAVITGDFGHYVFASCIDYIIPFFNRDDIAGNFAYLSTKVSAQPDEFQCCKLLEYNQELAEQYMKELINTYYEDDERLNDMFEDLDLYVNYDCEYTFIHTAIEFLEDNDFEAEDFPSKESCCKLSDSFILSCQMLHMATIVLLGD